jgi:hypothetical protein
MENQEVVKQNINLSLQAKTIEIGKIIYHVNQLSNFDIDDKRIVEWSKSIEEVLPNLEIEDLKILIRLFKIGDEYYDPKIGIQNIFTGLRNRFGGKYFTPKMVY